MYSAKKTYVIDIWTRGKKDFRKMTLDESLAGTPWTFFVFFYLTKHVVYAYNARRVCSFASVDTIKQVEFRLFSPSTNWKTICTKNANLVSVLSCTINQLVEFANTRGLKFNLLRLRSLRRIIVLVIIMFRSAACIYANSMLYCFSRNVTELELNFRLRISSELFNVVQRSLET